MNRFTSALRAFALPAVVGAVIFGSAGRWDLPFVWGVLAVLGAFYGALAACADPGMLCERKAPGPGNRDRLSRPLGGMLLIAHWVVAGLDVGRFHWSAVPPEIQAVGVAGFAAAMGILFWAMCVNPFYSSVVRVQAERGHYAVAAGPYRCVRHPGYAASLLSFVCGGVALGSWVALLPILVFVGLFLRRVLLEDRMLRQELPGYAEYAQRVRYRLVIGVY